jgi:NAD(P)-dependent dehydrogenase (short-subunit alcohol dehydrogenase family)
MSLTFVENLFSLDQKVAVVTGASRGLGYCIAQGYAKAGARVVISSRSEKEIVFAAREISEQSGSEVIGVSADSMNPDDVDNLFLEAEKHFGPVDVLMNNAGIINRPRANVWEIDEATWDFVLNINLKGTFLAVKRALEGMIPRRSGKIVCMASVTSVIAQEGHSPYVASKGGISQLVKAAALEAAPYNVNVNAIGPTYIKSDLVDKTLQDPVKQKQVLDKIPMGRVGDPEDLVGACIFLASNASDYITGHLLMIDAGHSIK